MSTELTALVMAGLEALGNPQKAKGMAAYMRTQDPFFGVGTPERRRLLRTLFREHAPRSQQDYDTQVRSLWGIRQREGRYMALDWACHFKPFITLRALPLYEQTIREGAWWDTVDVVAAHLVGRLLLMERDRMKPVLENWVSDECLWIRRTALLAQLKHKEATDEAQLFTYCLKLAREKDFFIRKAIGWALREYSRTKPEAVQQFLEQNRAEFSGLSFREGMKRLMRDEFAAQKSMLRT